MARNCASSLSTSGFMPCTCLIASYCQSFNTANTQRLRIADALMHQSKSTRNPHSCIHFMLALLRFFRHQHTRIIVLMGNRLPSFPPDPIASTHCHCLYINNKLPARRAVSLWTISYFQVSSTNNNVSPCKDAREPTLRVIELGSP